MRAREFLVPVALGILTTTLLGAGVVPGRWEKVDVLPAGSRVVVFLKAGDRIDCRFSGASPTDLTVVDLEGREQHVPKSEVREIVAHEKVKDSLRNGALIGAGVGFGVGFVALALANKVATASGPWWYDEVAGYAVASGLLGAGVGALVGTAIDAGHQGTDVLYRAP